LGIAHCDYAGVPKTPAGRKSCKKGIYHTSLSHCIFVKEESLTGVRLFIWRSFFGEVFVGVYLKFFVSVLLTQRLLT